MTPVDESSKSSSSSARMLFIVSSNVEKVDQTTRKLIRSHVMQGKKQKRIRAKTGQRTSGSVITRNRHLGAPVKLMDVITKGVPLLPGRIGLDLPYAEFRDEVEPRVLMNMMRFSEIAMGVIFPLLVGIGFQADTSESLYPMVLDSAALHITAFAVEGFIDKILRGKVNDPNPPAILHFQKGLRLLRERLLGEDDDTKISDSTISIVLKLASIALFDRDQQASKTHMDGLHKIVSLRGGMDAIEDPRLLREMVRIDLSIALLNQSDPLFFRQPSEPMPKYPEKLLPASGDKLGFQDNIKLIGPMNDGLSTAWRVMRRFCLLVNLGTQTQGLIDPEIIRETMAAVIYRLIQLGFTTGSLDEVVRLGLLTFSHHVFLQWHDIKTPYYGLATAYRNHLLDFGVIDRASPQLMVWLLMTAANSLFDISDEIWLEESLREHIGACEVKAWKGLQEILKTFMWMPLLDEHRGKQVYDFLFMDGSKC